MKEGTGISFQAQGFESPSVQMPASPGQEGSSLPVPRACPALPQYTLHICLLSLSLPDSPQPLKIEILNENRSKHGILIR